MKSKEKAGRKLGILQGPVASQALRINRGLFLVLFLAAKVGSLQRKL